MHPKSTHDLYVSGAHVEGATRTYACSREQLNYICIDVKQRGSAEGKACGTSPAFDK